MSLNTITAEINPSTVKTDYRSLIGPLTKDVNLHLVGGGRRNAVFCPALVLTGMLTAGVLYCVCRTRFSYSYVHNQDTVIMIFLMNLNMSPLIRTVKY